MANKTEVLLLQQLQSFPCANNILTFFGTAVNTVLGLEEGKECILVGTLYKHMKLKPSILDEYSKEVMLSYIALVRS